MGRRKGEATGEVAEQGVGEATGEVATVPMFRSKADAAGGPTTADVDPTEVENWRLYGWAVKEN